MLNIYNHIRALVPVECHGEHDAKVVLMTVGTLRNNSLFWGSHVSAERLSVILTIVRSALMNSLNVYQYIVFCLKTIRSYKGDLADLLANKWKPSEAALVPILA